LRIDGVFLSDENSTYTITIVYEYFENCEQLNNVLSQRVKYKNYWTASVLRHILEGMISAVDILLERGLYIETVDMRRFFVDSDGNVKTGFFTYTSNVNDLLTLA
jgi:hypothetical protein